MYSRTATSQSTKNYSQQINKLKSQFDSAETLVIGAGAGLSASAGFEYTGERFKKYFSDFEEKYGFHDMYSGGLYPYETLEEFWAFWSRYVYINRWLNAPVPVYEKLLSLAENKDYFVITTNVDHCFQKAGIDKKRLFYTQGDYGLFQCSKPCCNKTYDNEELIKKMYLHQSNMKIPTELIPYCPNCGKPLTMNLRCDDSFVEDEGWHRASIRYTDFLRARKNSKILFLELGVGYNTPAIIKYPFWNMTAKFPNAEYVCINKTEAFCPEEISDKSICVKGDINEALSLL